MCIHCPNRQSTLTTLVLLAIASILACDHHASASCWCYVAQSTIAEQSPVIVTGEITEIHVAEPSESGFDIAHIKVEAIHKNILKDTELRVGEILPARMHGANRSTRTSIDLRFAKGKLATWYVYVEEDRNFYICRHIQQCRPFEEEPVLGRKAILRTQSIDEADDTYGTTIETWIAKRKETTARAEIAREERRVRKAMLVALRSSLVVDGEFQPERMAHVFSAEESTRRDILHSSYGIEPMSPANWTQMQVAFLDGDASNNIRCLAAAKLGFAGVYEVAKPALLAALDSDSPRLRLFACQSLKKREDETAAPQVRKLLHDTHMPTRLMAVSTLGILGDHDDILPLLAQYKQEPSSWEADYHYCDSLSRLGETDVSLRLAARLLNDKNHGHYQGALSLERIDSPETVPIAMNCLLPELEVSIARLERHREGDRTFLALCRTLEKQTGLDYGVDVARWQKWWGKSADQTRAATLLQQYYRRKNAFTGRSNE